MLTQSAMDRHRWLLRMQSHLSWGRTVGMQLWLEILHPRQVTRVFCHELVSSYISNPRTYVAPQAEIERSSDCLVLCLMGWVVAHFGKDRCVILRDISQRLQIEARFNTLMRHAHHHRLSSSGGDEPRTVLCRVAFGHAAVATTVLFC